MKFAIILNIIALAWVAMMLVWGLESASLSVSDNTGIDIGKSCGSDFEINENIAGLYIVGLWILTSFIPMQLKYIWKGIKEMRSSSKITINHGHMFTTVS